jgi:hypothetical protein
MENFMEELQFEFEITEEEILTSEELFIEEEKSTFPFATSKKKKVPRHYINNADFCDALIKYKEECSIAAEEGRNKPKMPNYIGECFQKLAEGLSRRPNFFGDSYKDEMIGDGIENCLMYFENFNPEKTKNPFAYFTQILWWCFVRRIQKEKKQQYIKYKATENFGILDEAELLELGGGQIKQLEVYENMYDFIKKFEETEFTKSTKIKSKLPKKVKLTGIETFLEE